jgi:hypothetical protein
MLLTPAEDTDPKKLGRAVHIAAFEPERFGTRSRSGTAARARGKDWEASASENEGASC